MSQYSVLVIGGGGREHAICWKLAQSNRVKSISVSPGNSGMLSVPKVSLVPLNIKDNGEVVDHCKKHGIDLVVVGPEDYLANGLADELEKNGIHCFGPKKSAAQIEADKNWAKSFMDRHGIPTARWASFTSPEEAKKYVRESEFPALVVKATGLAAGKGVVVAADANEACSAIDEMLTNKKFGAAGETIVIEELLEGEEVSMLVFTDGNTFKIMPPAQDHKRIFDGDHGPNTGGMGAYAPCHLISATDIELAEKNIIQRAIAGFKTDGIHYVGVLYAGLMLTKSGPKTLEFNCRFGDPETQVILPLLDADLYEIMEACCKGTLCDMKINWHEKKYSAGVVLASRGYPASSSKGQRILGLEPLLAQDNCIIFHSGTAREASHYITNGGRVLMVTYLASSLELAAARATTAAKNISFEGKQFRSDIGHKGIAASILAAGKLSYKSSGVDIQAGDSLVSTIKPMVASTTRSGVLGAIGGFGGLFDAKAAGYRDPILVSGTDGVGTKLKIAISCGKHDTVGIDLVAMCVNDVLAHGAEPLFFLDYFACGRLDVGVASEVVSGIVEGCRRAGCALVGGETAEMPDMYADGEYDLAGFAVGAVERADLMPRSSEIKSGDVVIGLPSSGVHSNGFSLVRKILKLASKSFSDVAPFSKSSKTIAEELLVPTKIYTKSVIPALKSHLVSAFAHITGGGLTENIPRVLPEGLGVVLNAETWKIHPVFAWLATAGGVSEPEMLRTFNCGIGAIVICSPANQNDVLRILKDEGAVVIGRVEPQKASGHSRVIVEHFTKSIEREMRQYVPTLVERLMKPTKRVGVLISGSGTNLQALIDATIDSTQCIGAEIVLVISNKSSAGGLERAAKAGIPTKVILHNDYASREEFDREMNAALVEKGVDLVCLAGFMRILSKYFVQQWKGRLINIHPALLPSFKGANAHKDALAMGVRVSGCTVHFVDVEIDSGAIIEQAAVPVLPNDTVETLQKRVKHAEHQIYPKALQYLATGRVQLKDDNTLQWNY